MPPAARIGDMHVCPMVTGLVPHVGGPISVGCPTVMTGFMPAARMGDMAVCVGPPDSIIMGSPTVHIGGQMAARLGDPTVHGGSVVVGMPTVMIGAAGGGAGFPFAISVNADGSIQVGNKIKIVGDADFQAKTLADLVTIAMTPSSDPTRPAAGMTTLTSLDNGSHDVTIIETAGGNATNPDSMANAQIAGVGTNSTVEFNPDNEPATAADPSVNRPADVGLHHELAHADHASQGQIDLSPAANPNNPHVEEDNTISRDNQYRDDRDIPNRADHTVL